MKRHIETIARGVCIAGGKVLLCRPRNGSYSYLPGGHIEFGETGAEALAREVKEELGLDATVGELVGVDESAFVQRRRRHAEISLVYRMKLKGVRSPVRLASREDWIEFVWCPLGELDRANMLPEGMRRHVGL